MSTLSKIREKSALLMIIIGGALLAFILGDLISTKSLFTGSKENEVGEIAGKSITYQDFERKLMEAEENYKLNTGNPTMDDATRDMLRNQVWSQMVNETVMQKQYNELGLSVSSGELYDMVRGPEPHQSVRQAFTDPEAGVFDPSRVQQFFKSMDQDATGSTKARWVAFENGLKKERISEKYNNLLKQGLYVTNLQAKNDYVAHNQKAKLSYVVKRYNTMADSLVTYNESDLKKYYKAHIDNYEQEASRVIEYVIFDITPSEDDVKLAEEQAEKLAIEFKESTNDSVFAKINSDNEFNMDFKSKDQLDVKLQEELYSAEKGTVVGPYLDDKTLRISKLVDVKMSPDSVKARHILIKINNDDTLIARNKVDSLKNAIKKGGKFAALAEKYSEDFGSATKGGDLGWFTEGTMVKPFSEASFGGKKGDLPIVVSQFGVHLIEILEKSSESKKVKIANVDVKIEPSSLTYQNVYAKASVFASENKTEENFNKSITTQNLNKRIAENIKEGDRSVVGIENSRELIRWVYKTEAGQVSKPFEFEDKYVVAIVKEVNEKGHAPFMKVEETVKVEVIKEKKAELFIVEMKGVLNLSELAGKINTTVDTAVGVTFSSFAIPGVGREPFVIGSSFGMKKELVSEPLKGETGVYVIMLSDISEIEIPADFIAQKKQLGSNYKNRVTYEVFEALKENAKVEDNRAKFY